MIKEFKKSKRPVWLEIDLNNLKFNIKEIKKNLSAETIFTAVVKADAYGHGAVAISQAALEAGANRLAVAIPEEGIELREAGITAPIEVLGELLAEQLIDLVKYDLIPTISKFKTAERLNNLCAAYKLKKKIHLNVDTGMNRVGVNYKKALALLKKINKLPNLEIEGIMTHFARADELEKEYTLIQWERFNNLLEELKKEEIEIPIKHCANSAAVIDFPEFALDMVRVGIMIYGLKPSPDLKNNFNLKPVLTWKCRIVRLKDVPAGEGVSYGSDYITPQKEKIATLPLGYADGYARILGNKASVLIKAKRAPIRGRICMDQFMVDVSGIEGVELGEEVVLIGRQNDSIITADQLAELAATINYEIVSRISKRVARIYL
ncbi:alanine racemase [Halanaerobium sp. Z-7514]|uniref:Alanine racemase n=1 Tax=Halanaerobium polyolivorans TaxID=2886943 RepID=A0AAW4X0D7_9FIRM|nr:alanine racemase [Halanaerobium polyolivorans]MCC3145260.1 alanine racemase [Halanaerobium polyolivorans]RQD78880.1 MAG: alanine racemase [Halanaerobium sp. MSAO_Bac5]